MDRDMVWRLIQTLEDSTSNSTLRDDRQEWKHNRDELVVSLKRELKAHHRESAMDDSDGLDGFRFGPLE